MLADCRTAWSPWMEVIEPRMRTVDVEGREAGEKARRWEGRMRGVARDMMVVVFWWKSGAVGRMNVSGGWALGERDCVDHAGSDRED